MYVHIVHNNGATANAWPVANNNNNAAMSQMLGSRQAWVGLGVGALVSVLGGVFTLL